MKKVKTRQAVVGVLMAACLCLGMNSVSAEESGGDVKEGYYIESQSKQEFNYPSYNPTEPEIQLGHVRVLSVDESGVVGMDKEAVQGQLDEKGNVAVDGVKGKHGVYYVLEKSGDVISLASEGVKIVGTNGSTVRLVDVDAIHGRNGSADKDGFKSNLVPNGVLPKTGIEEVKEGRESWVMAVGIGLATAIACAGIAGIGLAEKAGARKGQRPVE